MSEQNFISAAEYLQHGYKIPSKFPPLPLKDEEFIDEWQLCSATTVLQFLGRNFGLPIENFPWQNPSEMSITLTQTLGGRLPVIETSSHKDFCSMEAVLNGRKTLSDLPPTVNAFTLQARSVKIYHQRIILLNNAPYSNIDAVRIGLQANDWLALSRKIRLRHECAHYETLRLFGGMRNHVLDEIIADSMGQIAAFGNFRADIQRAFFGLTQGQDTCDGRLTFYCQKVFPAERPIIYKIVNNSLDRLEREINSALQENKSELEILTKIIDTVRI